MRAALVALFLSGCCTFSAPTWHGPPSDHFDGERFFPPIRQERGPRDLLRWQLEEPRPARWQEIKAEPGPPPPRRVAVGAMRVTFVNHATVLLQMDGMNILTDPIWSERCSPLQSLGPKRVRPPGIRFEDLPPIDVVLLSHSHYDHMDVPTLQRIERAFPRVHIYAGLGNAAYLRGQHLYHVYDVDWWQQTRYGRVEITGVPAQHFSGRGLCDRNGTLFLGYVVRGPSGAVYFAGDTGYAPHFAEIGRRAGPLRLALLPIGAYKPEWFMAPMHMSPAEAKQAQRDLGSPVAVGIHFGTFQLADEPQDDPDRVRAERFWVLDFGEGREVP
jgi:L-ascorbate metabolism protein UlaG (beta-lactamase superfamily)